MNLEKLMNLLANKMGGGYFIGWAFSVFSIFLLSTALYMRNVLYLVLSLILIVALFMFSGHKSVFFSIFIVLFVFILHRVNYNRTFFLVVFLSFFLLVTILSLYLGSYNDIGSLLIRRLLFTHTVLNYTYIDFFSNKEFLYWSYGFLKSFFEYPYEKIYTLVIGEYLGMPTTQANTGFIAIGYMNMGIMGVIIYSILTIAIFNYINIFLFKEKKQIQFSLTIIGVYIFFETADLLTTLLSHGLFISLLLLPIIRSLK